MAESGPIFLGLITWIFILGPSTWTSAQTSHVCNRTDTQPVTSTAYCSEFINMIVKGYNLDKETQFPGKSDSYINAQVQKFLQAGNEHTDMCSFVKNEENTITECCQYYESSDPNDPLKCDIAVCSPECQNEGTCLTPPSQCLCKEGYTGYRCEDKVANVTDSLGYCYTEKNCFSNKTAGGFVGNLMTRDDCCNKESGKGWGVGQFRCQACPATSVTPTPTTSVVKQENQLDFRTCMTYGISYYRTFDGLEYTFPGQCTYTMLKEQTNGWNVEMQMKNCSSFSSCRKRVTVHLGGGDTIITEAGVVFVGNEEFILTGEEPRQSPSGSFTIRRKAGWLFIDSPKGFRMKTDGVHTVYFTLDRMLQSEGYQFAGLCGNFNDAPNDEFITKIGEPASNSIYFANSWTVTNTADVCNPAGYEPEYCENRAMQDPAERDCSAIYSEKFKPCHKIMNPTYWYRLCVNQHCKATSDAEKENVKCGYLDIFAQVCAQNNVILPWRSNELCPKICPLGLEYNECSSQCPRTCKALYTVMPDYCLQDCVPGCECPQGTFVQDGKCVTPDECVCQYQRRNYNTGDTIKQGCNKCTCDKGRWRCTEDKCSSVCQLVGINHMTTFDGINYNFEPRDCQYTLVEPETGAIDQDSRSNLTITAEFDACVDTNEGNCLKKVIIKYRGQKVEMSKDTLSINNVDLTTSIKSTPYHSKELYVKHVTSKFIMLRAFGLKVLYDKYRLLYINLDPFYSNKIRGMCGKFNYIQDDDFTAPNGGEQSATNFFIDSYSARSCPASNVYKKEYSSSEPESDAIKEICSHLHTGELFRMCYLDLGPVANYYHDICLEDTKRRQSTADFRQMCDITAAMARECYFIGHSVNWTQYLDFPKRCEEHYTKCDGAGMAYRECATPCEGSCRDLQFKDSSCESDCIPGCMCPEGMHRDDYGICVKEKDCTCYDQYAQDGNRIKNPGDIISRSCTECVCVNGTFQCGQETCEETIVCPKNQVWLDGVDNCQQLTCSLLDKPMDCTSSTLYQGCGCPEGLVMAPDGTCVVDTDCPCSLNGEFSKPGEIIEYGCKEMRCENRKWIKIAERDCPAVCWASGDPHYYTFDGYRYSFQGSCQYVLARDKVDGKFSILVENVQCGSSGVTCTKRITVQIYGYTLDLVRGKDVNLTTDGSYVTKGLVISQQSFWTNINAHDLGVSLMWDGATRVYVYLSKQWMDKVEGLCGNYDGSNSDVLAELRNKDGEASSNPAELASSWETSSSCAHPGAPEPINLEPCSDKPHRLEWARTTCEIILKLDGPFSECISKQTPDKINQFYQECLFDSCSCDQGGDCECLCTAISNFAEDCNRLGVHTKWRHHRLCPIMCENGSRYTPCAPPCPQTCVNIGDEPEPWCKDTQCVEGCFCPEGYVQQGEGCVLAEDCPCMHEGQEFQPGTQIQVACMNCTCVNGRFACEGENCTVCQVDEFSCLSDRECVHNKYICDGQMDCRDGSDEFNCTYTCRPGEFQCSTGNCIDSGAVCDGSQDCLDGADEASCKVTCSDNQFTCDSGTCLPETFRCDGHPDCGMSDTSDEKGCNVTEECIDIRRFRCQTGDCLPLTLKCDEHDDCGDGSDEVGCNNCTCTDAFTCTADCTCIPSNEYCDGTPQCPDGEDEPPECSYCTEYSCGNGHECVNNSLVCDGKRDCSDGSDEEGCATTTPLPTTTPKVTTITTPSTTLPSSTTVTTPCEQKEAMESPALLPSSQIIIEDRPELNKDNLRNDGSPALTIPPSDPFDPVLIRITLVNGQNPDGVYIGSVNPVSDNLPNNIKAYKVGYIDAEKGNAETFLPDEFSGTDSAPVDKKTEQLIIVIIEATDINSPVQLKLEIQACIEPVPTTTGSTVTTAVTTVVTTTSAPPTPCADQEMLGLDLQQTAEIVTVSTPDALDDAILNNIFGDSGLTVMQPTSTVDLVVSPLMEVSGVNTITFNTAGVESITVKLTRPNEPTVEKQVPISGDGPQSVDLGNEPATKIEFVINARPNEVSTISGLRVEVCVHPTGSTTTPITTPQVSTPVVTTTGPPTSTYCDITMIDQNLPNIQDLFKVDSPNNPPGSDPIKAFTDEGWEPTSDTFTPTIKLTPEETTSVEGINTVELTVEDVIKVIVTLRDENGDIVKEAEEVTPLGLGPKPVSLDLEGSPAYTIEITAVPEVGKTPTFSKVSMEVCVHVTTTTPISTTVVPTTTTPPTTTICEIRMIDLTNFTEIFDVSSPDNPAGGNPSDAATPGGWSPDDGTVETTIVLDVKPENDVEGIEDITLNVDNVDKVKVIVTRPDGSTFEKEETPPAGEGPQPVTIDVEGNPATKIEIILVPTPTQEIPEVTDLVVEACVHPKTTTPISTTVVPTTTTPPTTTICEIRMIDLTNFTEIFDVSSPDNPAGGNPSDAATPGGWSPDDGTVETTIVLDVKPENDVEGIEDITLNVDNVDKVKVIVTRPDGSTFEKEETPPAGEGPQPVTIDVEGNPATKIEIILVPTPTQEIPEVTDLVVEACVHPKTTTPISTTVVPTTTTPPTTTICEIRMIDLTNFTEIFDVSSPDNPAGGNPSDAATPGGWSPDDGTVETTIVLDVKPENDVEGIEDITLNVDNVDKVKVIVTRPDGSTFEKEETPPAGEGPQPVTIDVEGNPATKIEIILVPTPTQEIPEVTDLVVEACVHPKTTTPISTTVVPTTTIPPTTTICEIRMIDLTNFTEIFDVSSPDNPAGGNPSDAATPGGWSPDDGTVETTIVLDVKPENDVEGIEDITLNVDNVDKVKVIVTRPDGSTFEKEETPPAGEGPQPVTIDVEGNPATKIEIILVPTPTQEIPEVTDLVVEACVHPKTTTPISTTVVPTTTTPPTTTICEIRMIDLTNFTEIFDVSSPDNPAGGNPSDAATPGGWSPDDGTVETTIVLDVKPENDVEGIEDITLNVDNVDKVKVIVTRPDGSTFEKEETPPAGEGPQPVTIDVEGNPATKIEIILVPTPTQEIPEVTDLVVEACVHPKTTTPISTTVVPTTTTPPTTTICEIRMIDLTNFTEIFDVSSPNNPAGGNPSDAATPGGWSPDDGTVETTIVLDVKPENDVEGIEDITLNVDNVDKVKVIVTRPDGSTFEKEETPPAGEGPQPVTIDVEGNPATKIEIILVPTPTQEIPEVTDLVVEACVHPKTTTPISTTVVPTTTTPPTTTICEIRMIDLTNFTEIFDVSSPDNPAGENPSDAATPGGWSPDDGTVETTIVLDVKPENDVEGIEDITLNVDNVDKVKVIVTRPDGSTFEKEETPPAGEGPQPVTIDVEGNPATKIEIILVPTPTQEIPLVTDLVAEACVHPKTTTPMTTTLAPTTSTPPVTSTTGPTTTFCEVEMVDFSNIDKIFEVTSPDNPVGANPEDAAFPVGWSPEDGLTDSRLILEEKPDSPVEGIRNIILDVANVSKVVVKAHTPDGIIAEEEFPPLGEGPQPITIDMKGIPATKLEIILVPKVTEEVPKVLNLVVEACVHPKTTTPVPTTSTPPVTTTTAPTTTICEVDMVDSTNFTVVFEVSSPDNPPNEDPLDATSGDGWRPEDGLTDSKLVLDVKPENTVDVVEEITLEIENATKVVVKITRPDGTKETFEELVPDGVGPQPMTIDLEGNPVDQIEIILVPKPTEEIPRIYNLSVIACVHPKEVTTTVVSTVATTATTEKPVVPTTTVPSTVPSTTACVKVEGMASPLRIPSENIEISDPTNANPNVDELRPGNGLPGYASEEPFDFTITLPPNTELGTINLLGTIEAPSNVKSVIISVYPPGESSPIPLNDGQPIPIDEDTPYNLQGLFADKIDVSIVEEVIPGNPLNVKLELFACLEEISTTAPTPPTLSSTTGTLSTEF